MGKMIRAEAMFLGFRNNNLNEMIIGSEVYRKDVKREVTVKPSVIEVMQQGQKGGWFYVKELETIMPKTEKKVWDPKPVAKPAVNEEVAEVPAEEAVAAEETENIEAQEDETVTASEESAIEEDVASENTAEEAIAEETEDTVDFSTMKKADLIQYAKDNGIEIPDGATSKEIKEILSNN